MPKASPALVSFNGGELSPALEGRIDIQKYALGCAKLENFIPMIQGPARRRSGTRFVAEVKDNSARTYLSRFIFNVTDSYVLEWGNLYLRFYTDHGRLLDSLSNIYEIVTPYGSADLRDADAFFALSMAQSADVVYIANANGDFAPRKLSRFSHTNWTLTEIEFEGGPFADINTNEDISVTISAGNWHENDTVTVTATDSIFFPEHVGALFYIEQQSLRDIRPWETGQTIQIQGRARRYNGVIYRAESAGTGGFPQNTGDTPPTHLEGSAWDDGGSGGIRWTYINAGFGWLKIDSYISPTQVQGHVLRNLPVKSDESVEATFKWAFGAWNDHDGWPTKVAFYKERLVFARGNRIWTSVSGDYEVFTARDDGGQVLADMAITIDVPTQDRFQWLADRGDLIVGTAGGEFAAGPNNAANPLGPENIQIKPQLSHGSRNVAPIIVGPSLLFAQTAGRKLRELKFSFDTNSYASEDLTALAEHITRGGIIDMAFQQEPDSVLWVALGSET